MRIINKSRYQGESKALITNFLSLTLLQIAGYIFPLLTVPYLAHVIGVDRYGEIAFAMAIMIYFETLVDYGFIYSAVRDVSRCRTELEKVSQIYSNVMWSRIILVIISFLILILLITLVPKFTEMKWVLLASFLMVIGHAMFPDWIFQALEKMKYITIFNLVIKLFFTVTVFIFIRNADDYLLQPIFTSLGYIISGIGAIYLIHKWGIKISKPQISELKDVLKTNFDLFLNELVPNLYNSTSIILLGIFHGDNANGIYDSANRFNAAGGRLFSIISRTFYPFLARRMDKHDFFIKLNIFSASFIALVLFIFAPWIIKGLFPSDFDGAINVLRIISISLIFLAMSNVFGTNYLILKGYEKEMRRISVMSSIFGLIIGIPLIYYWSYIGVAATITLSRGCIALCSYIKANSIKNEEKKKLTQD